MQLLLCLMGCIRTTLRNVKRFVNKQQTSKVVGYVVKNLGESMETASGSKRNLFNATISLKEALLALTAIKQDVVLLNYGNVLVRKGYENLANVRLLSGGAAGADLTHALFVGKGMLTGAVLGADTAPSSRLILHTIKELSVGENCGIFVIVQAGPDLFNFGLAVERAISENCRTRVKLLHLHDDKSMYKQRYSCGFILLTKVLGAMAENGAFYDDVYQCYKDLEDSIATVSLQFANEETERNIRLNADFERHFRKIINQKSQSNLNLHPSIPMVALINTSKRMERITELGLVKFVVDRMKELGVCVVRLYFGNYTAAAPGTATLTMMRIYDKKIVDYLDAPCDAPGWRQLTQFQPEITTNNEIPGHLTAQGKRQIPWKGPKLDKLQTDTLTKSVQFACDALISCEKQLNVIDSERSRGNVGTRFRTIADHVNKTINKSLPTECPYTFLKKLGVVAESSMGGTMGSIYGILLESAANVFGDLPETEVVTAAVWAKALTAATEALRTFCSEEMKGRTMYCAIKACEATVGRAMGNGGRCLEWYGFGVSAAEEAAQRTRIGQWRYADAGAHAVGIWMRAVFEGVKLMSA